MPFSYDQLNPDYLGNQVGGGSAPAAQVAFSQVASNLRTPFVAVEIDPTNASGGALRRNLPVLLIGSYDNTITTTAANTPVPIYSPSQAATLFGAGSQLHEMAEYWFANNAGIPVHAAPVPDAVGASVSTWTLTCTIPSGSIKNGTLALYVNGVPCPVGITEGMTVAQVATAIAAAVNGQYGCPVTATAALGVATLTSKGKGAWTAGIDVRLNYAPTDATPGNLAVAIASASTGATNPVLTTLIANVVNAQYQLWVLPYTDTTSVSAIVTELTRRWGAMVQAEGFAIAAVQGSMGTLGTYGSALNSQMLCVVGYNNSPSPAYGWAAAVAGQVATSASIDPARPFNTLPLALIQAPPLANRWTQAMANSLLWDGIATTYVDAGGTVRIQRLITTYQTDVNGAPTQAFLDLNSPLTLAYIRADLRAYISGKYPRTKLADDGTRYAPGQAIVTPSVLKAEIVARARMWEEAGLIQGVDRFAASLSVVRNSADPTRVDVFMAPELVSSLQVVGVLIQYLLG
jgi:phage tail sheath gpL-like